MRTALLAADRTCSQGNLRASLMLAGEPLILWQMRLAQELRCGRLIVLTDAADETFAEVERACRAGGMAFHRLARFAGLAALLHVDDELLLLGDGLLAERAALAALLAPEGPDKPLRKLVLCLPDDDARTGQFPEDFERIDAARCWAGVAVMRAAPVQQLGDFPPDSNPVSLLLRMALQAGTPCHTLAPSERDPAQWLLAHEAEVIADHERMLIAQHGNPVRWSAPGRALSAWFAARIGGRGLAGGEPAASIAGLALLIMAVASALTGWGLTTLVCAVLGSFALDLGQDIARLRLGLRGGAPAAMLARLHDPGRDGLAMLAIMAALGSPALAALAPLAIGTARLAARDTSPGAAAFWQDRTVQLAVLMLGAALGWLAEATALLALGALAQALFARPARPIPAQSLPK
ncbi:MAG: hypothetical protein ACJLS3_07355 [Erythrobacter sp.]